MNARPFSTAALRLACFAALSACAVLGDRPHDHGNGANIQGNQPNTDAAEAATALTFPNSKSVSESTQKFDGAVSEAAGDASRVPANQAPEHANVAESTKLGAETNGNRAVNRDRGAGKQLMSRDICMLQRFYYCADYIYQRFRIPAKGTQRMRMLMFAAPTVAPWSSFLHILGAVRRSHGHFENSLCNFNCI